MTVVSLQFQSIQTFAVKRISNYLSKELHAQIDLESIYFKPFSALSLHKFSIKDKFGNELIYTESIEAKLVLTQLLNNKIIVEELDLTNARINYQSYKDSSNYQFLINYFSSSKSGGSQKKGMQFDLRKLVLKNNRFIYVNHQDSTATSGINFADIELMEVSGVLDKIKKNEKGYFFNINRLHAKDKSNFHLKELSARAFISSNEIELNQLTLRTNRSKIGDYAKLSFDEYADFSDFVNRVKISTHLKNAHLDSRDIEFFAPDMKYVRFKADIVELNAEGPIKEIEGKRIHLKLGASTEIKGRLTIKGLPNIDKTLFNASFERLHSNVLDIEEIVPELGNLKNFKLPQQIHNLQSISYEGKFDGYYNDFDLNGVAKTKLGEIDLTSNVNLVNDFKYTGHLSSSTFDFGALLENPTFASAGIRADFAGQNLDFENLKLQASGELNHSLIKNYAYDSISFDGEIINKSIHLKGQIKDPNLRLDYLTTVDLSNQSPQYSLETDLHYANLVKLKIFEKDSVILTNTQFNTNLQGSNLNNLIGNLSASEVNIQSSRGQFAIDYIDIIASGNEQNRQFELNSDVAQISILGTIDLNTIRPYFESIAMRYAPAIGLEEKPYNPQNFDLDLEIKSFKPISAFFDPSLSLDDGAKLKANFSSKEYKASFTAISRSMTYKGMTINNLNIVEDADGKQFSLSILADRISLTDSTYIDDIHIGTILKNDSLRFGIQLSDRKYPNYLDLNGNIHFAHNLPAYVHFTSSEIRINNNLWRLNDDAQLRVSKGKLYFNNLLIRHQQQQVALNGIVSNQNDELNIDFKRFGLASLDGLTKPYGIKLDGEMNGTLKINSILKDPYISANINTSSILYNKLPIGKLSLDANFDPQTKLADISLDLLDEQNKGIAISGSYNLNAKQEAINLKAKLKDVNLNLLQPFIKELVSNVEGKTNGDVTIRGNLNNLRFSGAVQIPYASLDINYLKTKYRLENQNALIDNNSFLLTNLRIKDINNHEAVANGVVNLQQLADPTIDVQVQASNFQILNTTYKDNNLYYGVAHATGNFSFAGATSAMNINIKAKSNNHTSLHIPFNSSMTIAENDFIYFVNPDETKTTIANKKVSFNGLTMNMDLQLTPEAEVNIATNMGSLKGNGTGEVTLKISSLGDFEMFGDYSIHSGKYHFTAQDFINKYFDIKQGGTIRWTGNPSEAVINIVAMYQQRTSVSALYNAAGRSGNEQRVLAQADMNIKGTIYQPDVTFTLNFPQDPYIMDELQSFLSDANNVNQQALSLIMRRSFTPNSTVEIGKEVNSTLISAGTEIAFNQLNSIISQSLNVNFFDLNIRSFNDASASFRLFNDRLIFTGGISDRSTVRLNDLNVFSDRLATDAELTFNIRRDGSLRFRAYNRLNNRNFLNPYDDYISAAGLVYRQEFNSFREFWRTLWWRQPKRRTDN